MEPVAPWGEGGCCVFLPRLYGRSESWGIWGGAGFERGEENLSKTERSAPLNLQKKKGQKSSRRYCKGKLKRADDGILQGI